MTFGRRMTTARAAVFAFIALAWAAPAAYAQGAKPPKAPPVVYSAEVNMCRATCGDIWLKSRSCRNEARVCLARADRAYRQCLPDCVAGKWPAGFAPPAPPPPPPPPVQAAAPPPPVDNGPDSTAARPWVDARAPWRSLPDRTVRVLPYTFTLPPRAYDYAGITDPIRPFVTKTPALLKVEVMVLAGRAGVSLAAPDGSALVSKEAALAPSPKVQTVYFEVGPQSPPVALLLRNYDGGGAPGSLTIRAVTFARIAVLPPGQAGRLGALK